MLIYCWPITIWPNVGHPDPIPGVAWVGIAGAAATLPLWVSARWPQPKADGCRKQLGMLQITSHMAQEYIALKICIYFFVYIYAIKVVVVEKCIIFWNTHIHMYMYAYFQTHKTNSIQIKNVIYWKLLYFVWSPPWHLYILLQANLLAFYMAFYLAYLLAFYLAYLLAFYLA